MSVVTFHNCKPPEESALGVSVAGGHLTPDQLDRLTTILNREDFAELITDLIDVPPSGYVEHIQEKT